MTLHGLEWLRNTSLRGFGEGQPTYVLGETLVDAQRWNRYAYVRNNPLKYTDPDGRILETLWDIANIGMGVWSLGGNVAAGNWAAAALDVGGIVLDGLSAATPFVPGGAGTAIRSARAAETGAGIARNAANGAAFEKAVMAEVKGSLVDVAEQVTVRTAGGSKTRLDILGRDAAGRMSCIECKGSAAARLSPNQKAAFPEIAQTGAVVVGRGNLASRQQRAPRRAAYVGDDTIAPREPT